MMESLVADPSQNYSIFEKIFKNTFRFAIGKSQTRKQLGFLMRYLDNQYKKLDTLIRKAPQKNSSGKMITYTFPIHSENDEKGLRLNDDHFKNRKLKKFKAYYFYIPVDYHQLLVDRYDNYMELPPYEDRKSNHQWVN